MKRILMTIVGVATLAIPAIAQKHEIKRPDAQPANAVQIPEGAFEIALPNLSIAPVNRDSNDNIERVDPADMRVAIPHGRRASVKYMNPRTHLRSAPTSSDKLVAESTLLGIPPSQRPTIKAMRERTTLRLAPALSIEPSQSVSDRNAADDHGDVSSSTAGPRPGDPAAMNNTDTRSGFSLGAAAPNPAVDVSSISFALSRDGYTSLAVYDNAGRVVATLANENLNAGPHQRAFDVTNLPAGLYLYRLSSGGYVETRTLTVVR